MQYPLLVVIHETLISAEQSKLLHADPEYYGSYHALIERSGNITYLVPAEHKAFAASVSSYTNSFGEVEQINGSVDDFAYHIALETPPDGIQYNSREYHTGYTIEQYQSLAWLCAATGVQQDRITTHGEITSPKRLEPRCLNYDYFYNLYSTQHSLGRKLLDFGVLEYVS